MTGTRTHLVLPTIQFLYSMFVSLFFYLAFDIFGIGLARKQHISMYEKLALKCEPIIRGRDVGRTTLEVPISTALTSALGGA